MFSADYKLFSGDQRNQIPRPLCKQTLIHQPSFILVEFLHKMLNAYAGCHADIRLQQSSYAYLAQSVRNTVSCYARWHLASYRLGHNMSKTSVRLTSRSATPLGDPRGVPKRVYKLRKKYKFSDQALYKERLAVLIVILRSIVANTNLILKSTLKRLEAKMADLDVLSDVDIVELLDSIMDDSNQVITSDSSDDFGSLPSLAVANFHSYLAVLDNFDLECFGDTQEVNTSQTSFQNFNQLNTTETGVNQINTLEDSSNTSTHQLYTEQKSFMATQTGFEISENTEQPTNIDIRNLLENYAETISVETNNSQYVNALPTAESWQHIQNNFQYLTQNNSISSIQQPLLVINPITIQEQNTYCNASYLSPETSCTQSSSYCSPTTFGTVSDSQTSNGSQSPSSSNGCFSDSSLSPLSTPAVTTEHATTSITSLKTKRNYKNPEKVKQDNLRACERYREKKKRAEEVLSKEHSAVKTRNNELKTTLNKLQQELIRLQQKIITERITI